MTAFLLSLGSALLRSGSDLSTKLVSRTVADQQLILFSQRLASVVVIAVLITALGGFSVLGLTQAFNLPALQDPFFIAFALANAVLLGASFHFYIKALHISDASLVAPITLLTPVLLIVTSPIFLGESVSLVGGLGILLAVVGLYTLEYSAADVAPGRFLEPLRSIATNRGAQYMLATAGIWGITATFDKIGVQATTPLVWLLLQHTLITLGAGIYLYWRQRIPRSISSPTATKLALPGIAEALSAALHMYAISIWYVPYVIIIKRTSVLFTVLFGSVFFQEEKLRSRLTGTMVMLIGVALIVLYG